MMSSRSATVVSPGRAVALLEGVGEGHEVGQAGRDLLERASTSARRPELACTVLRMPVLVKPDAWSGTIGERGRGAGDRHRQHRCAGGFAVAAQPRSAAVVPGPGQHDEPDDEQGSPPQKRTARPVAAERIALSSSGGPGAREEAEMSGRDSSSVMEALTCGGRPNARGQSPEGDVDVAEDRRRDERSRRQGIGSRVHRGRIVTGLRTHRGDRDALTPVRAQATAVRANARICRTGREPT